MVISQRLNKVVKKGISILKPSNCSQNFFSIQNALSETLDHIKTLKSDNKVNSKFYSMHILAK